MLEEGQRGQGRARTTSTSSSRASTTTSPPTARDAAVDPKRRLRPERAQGPVPRRGRRRRGASLAIPRWPAAATRRKKGLSVFNDLRQFKNHEAPDVDRWQVPLRLDPEAGREGQRRSSTRTATTRSSPVADAKRSSAPTSRRPTEASNTLMITDEQSDDGQPADGRRPADRLLLPRLHLRDRHARRPTCTWRGATSAPFPGYLLIGRGEDFATTLTSASADIVDQYAETLCGGSDTSTSTRASAATMEQVQRRHARTASRSTSSRPRSTARSPATRRSTASKVAISSKRSSYGKDSLDLLFNRRLSNGQVDSPRVVLQSREQDAADVQLVLHRQQGHRAVHQRHAADAPRSRSIPAC